jgi:hypothetical protein
MFEGISNAVKTVTPAFTVGCYTAAGLIAGRKVCVGAGCKVYSVVAEYLNEETAEQWNRMGNKYLAMAKKDIAQDLTTAAALVAAGFAVDCADDYLFPEPIIVKGWGETALEGLRYAKDLGDKGLAYGSYYGQKAAGVLPDSVRETGSTYIIKPASYVVKSLATTVKDQLPSVTAFTVLYKTDRPTISAVLWVAANVLYNQI